MGELEGDRNIPCLGERQDSVTPAGQRQTVPAQLFAPLPVPLFLTAAALAFLIPRGLGSRKVTLVLLVGSKGMVLFGLVHVPKMKDY